jgi:hypothetical protein
VALPLPAFTEVLTFMFIPFLKQDRRSLEARLYSSFDFHVLHSFRLASIGTVTNEQSVTRDFVHRFLQQL